VVGCWHGYLSGARCRFAYGPADATATHYLLIYLIQTGFTCVVLAHPGSHGQRVTKLVLLLFSLVYVSLGDKFGLYMCLTVSVCLLSDIVKFDNSFSWFHGKRVWHSIDITEPSTDLPPVANSS